MPSTAACLRTSDAWQLRQWSSNSSLVSSGKRFTHMISLSMVAAPFVVVELCQW
jgi:hypothetical protein